jgi:hypothetical protein
MKISLLCHKSFLHCAGAFCLYYTCFFKLKEFVPVYSAIFHKLWKFPCYVTTQCNTGRKFQCSLCTNVNEDFCSQLKSDSMSLQVKSDFTSQTESQLKYDSTQTESQLKSDSSSQTDSQSKSDSTSQSKSDSISQTESQLKSDSTSQTDSQLKSDSTSQSKVRLYFSNWITIEVRFYFSNWITVEVWLYFSIWIACHV